MDKVTEKKIEIIRQITQYIVVNGMSDIGLRKLADVTDTSDRMLIYYFETKNQLIGQVLQSIAANFQSQLDAILGQEKRTSDVLLHELLSLSSHPQHFAFIQLWFEIIGLATRGDAPYAENATVLAANWLKWIEARLADSQKEQAVALFAELEGRLLLKIVGLDPEPKG